MRTLLTMPRSCSKNGRIGSLNTPARPHLTFVTGTLFGQPTAENERAPAHEGLLCPSQTASKNMR
jgi:hypothetical protein